MERLPKKYRSSFLTILLSFLIIGMAAYGGNVPLALAAGDLALYGDSLTPSWLDESWGLTDGDPNYASTVYVHGANGTSISASILSGSSWGALQIVTNNALNAADYTGVSFWLHGGATGGQQLVFGINSTTQGYVSINPTTQWQHVTVSFAQLNNPGTISALFWQTADNTHAQAAFYIDDITLIGSTAEPPTATLTRTPTATQTASLP